jgi:hypothetical protein
MWHGWSIEGGKSILVYFDPSNLTKVNPDSIFQFVQEGGARKKKIIK